MKQVLYQLTLALVSTVALGILASADTKKPQADAKVPDSQVIDLDQVLREARSILQDYAARPVPAVSAFGGEFGVSDTASTDPDLLVQQAEEELARAEQLLQAQGEFIVELDVAPSYGYAGLESPDANLSKISVVEQAEAAKPANILDRQLQTLQQHLDTFASYMNQAQSDRADQQLDLGNIGNQISDQRGLLERVDHGIQGALRGNAGQGWTQWLSSMGMMLVVLGVLGLIAARLLKYAQPAIPARTVSGVQETETGKPGHDWQAEDTQQQQPYSEARVNAALKITRGAAEINNTGAVDRALKTLQEMAAPEDLEKAREIIRSLEKH